jgi:hypothetical protein
VMNFSFFLGFSSDFSVLRNDLGSSSKAEARSLQFLPEQQL